VLFGAVNKLTDAVHTAATAAVVSTGREMVAHPDIDQQATLKVGLSFLFGQTQGCYGCGVTVSP
jgi:hypothetical protein